MLRSTKLKNAPLIICLACFASKQSQNCCAEPIESKYKAWINTPGTAQWALEAHPTYSFLKSPDNQPKWGRKFRRGGHDSRLQIFFLRPPQSFLCCFLSFSRVHLQHLDMHVIMWITVGNLARVKQILSLIIADSTAKLNSTSEAVWLQVLTRSWKDFLLKPHRTHLDMFDERTFPHLVRFVSLCTTFHLASGRTGLNVLLTVMNILVRRPPESIGHFETSFAIRDKERSWEKQRLSRGHWRITKSNERLPRARQMPAGSDTSCNPYFLPLCCLLPEAILDYSLDLLDLKSANILFAK